MDHYIVKSNSWLKLTDKHITDDSYRSAMMKAGKAMGSGNDVLDLYLVGADYFTGELELVQVAQRT